MNTPELFGKLGSVDLKSEPLIVLDNVDFDSTRFTSLVKESSTWELLTSSDGAVSHVFEDPGADAADHSHTNEFFGLHTDGQYLPDVPPFCLLYCVDSGEGNTPTVFADTGELIERLQEEGVLQEAEAYDFIYTKKEGTQYRRPLIEIDPDTNQRYMCVATKSPAIKVVPNDSNYRTQDEADEFFDRLSKFTESELDLFVHHWQTGQMVLFDNRRLIHGRGLPEQVGEINTDSERHLVRIWLKNCIVTALNSRNVDT